MKQIEKTASATNFTAINLGKLNELGDYLLELAPEIKIPGKCLAGLHFKPQEANFHSSYSNREQKPVFFTLTKHMKNFISSLVETENFK